MDQSEEESAIVFPKESSVAKDVHGFFDIVFKNNYITPRGLLVTDTGLTIQILSGLILDVYQSKCGLIDKVSIYAGIWNDLWTEQDNPYVGAWNEMDWFVGINVLLAKNWKWGVQFIQFVSPPHNFRPESNIEFLLAYDDSSWGYPITLNPYVKFFWAVAGDSTVVVGRGGNTYDVEIGLIPTWKFDVSCLPITFTMPTWITVGPENFWNGGPLALKCKHGHFGVFSTGLKSTIPLNFIPKRLGDWYFDFGIQYYYLINENLLQAQTFTLGSSFKHTKRKVLTYFAGFGFNF